MLNFNFVIARTIENGQLLQAILLITSNNGSMVKQLDSIEQLSLWKPGCEESMMKFDGRIKQKKRGESNYGIYTSLQGLKDQQIK